MLENGYIKIFRSLLNWEWYTDQNTKDLFLHLLITVNYEPQKWRGIVINRGQRVSSYQVLAKELRLSVQSIRTALKHLISTGEVTHNSTSKYGIFTINNYDKFQNLTDNSTDSQQSTNSQLTVSQQSANNKGRKLRKNKKEKESNNNPLNPPAGDNPKNDELNEIFKTGTKDYSQVLKKSILEWIAYKKEREKKANPYLPKSLKTFLKKFKEYADLYGEREFVEMVEENIANQYQGITWDKLKKSKTFAHSSAGTKESSDGVVDEFEEAYRELGDAPIWEEGAKNG